MSSGYMPSGPAGESSVRLDHERREELNRRRPPSATAFPARSTGGRGWLRVSDGLVSFHPRRGDDAAHVGDAVPVTYTPWAAHLGLETPHGALDVSVPRWRSRHLMTALRAAGLDVKR